METGIIKRVVHKAHAKETGKQRGEWIKLSDAEYRLIMAIRAAREREGLA